NYLSRGPRNRAHACPDEHRGARRVGRWSNATVRRWSAERMSPAMRIGVGHDLHPLAAGRDLVLGGVHVPFGRGLQGHSDGDVLTHAIADALIGAAGRGDIGQWFPDTDERYRGANSLDLLKQVAVALGESGW